MRQMIQLVQTSVTQVTKGWYPFYRNCSYKLTEWEEMQRLLTNQANDERQKQMASKKDVDSLVAMGM